MSEVLGVDQPLGDMFSVRHHNELLDVIQCISSLIVTNDSLPFMRSSLLFSQADMVLSCHRRCVDMVLMCHRRGYGFSELGKGHRIKEHVYIVQH